MADYLQHLLDEDDLGFTLQEDLPSSVHLTVMLVGRQDDAKLGGDKDRAGAALDKSAMAVADRVARVLRISSDHMANSAFASSIKVTSNGTYDCNQTVSCKTQLRHTVMICFSGITEEEVLAALSTLHTRSDSGLPFSGVSALATLEDVPIFEGKSDRSTRFKDLRVEIGLSGHEAKFLALAVDALSLADDQGMRFSLRFQPARPFNVPFFAPCISHAIETQLAPVFLATKPVVHSVLPLSPFGLRRAGHLPSAVLVTVSAPPGTGILALPSWLRLPTGQVFHPGHGRGNRPIYCSVQPKYFLNGSYKDGMFYPTGAVQAAAQNGHSRQLAALRDYTPPSCTRAVRQKQRYQAALQASPPGTDLGALGIHPHRQRAAAPRNSRSRSRSPPRDARRARTRLDSSPRSASACPPGAAFPDPPPPPPGGALPDCPGAFAVAAVAPAAASAPAPVAVAADATAAVASAAPAAAADAAAAAPSAAVAVAAAGPLAGPAAAAVAALRDPAAALVAGAPVAPPLQQPSPPLASLPEEGDLMDEDLSGLDLRSPMRVDP